MTLILMKGILLSNNNEFLNIDLNIIMLIKPWLFQHSVMTVGSVDAVESSYSLLQSRLQEKKRQINSAWLLNSLEHCG